MEIFINPHVTLCSMDEFIKSEIEYEKVEEICKKNNLNMNLLKKLFLLKAKGFNNLETAQKLGIHRVTVQRYTHSLKRMKESEFNIIYKFIMGVNDDETNI